MFIHRYYFVNFLFFFFFTTTPERIQINLNFDIHKSDQSSNVIIILNNFDHFCAVNIDVIIEVFNFLSVRSTQLSQYRNFCKQLLSDLIQNVKQNFPFSTRWMSIYKLKTTFKCLCHYTCVSHQKAHLSIIVILTDLFQIEQEICRNICFNNNQQMVIHLH